MPLLQTRAQIAAAQEAAAIEEHWLAAFIAVSLVALAFLIFGRNLRFKKFSAGEKARLNAMIGSAMILLGIGFKFEWLAIIGVIFLLAKFLGSAGRGLKQFELAAIPGYEDDRDESLVKQLGGNALVYAGDRLEFPEAALFEILNKRFPYFKMLDEPRQQSFIERLQKFMRCKYFVIHDDEGFKEMPVLISAAAIQVSMGMDNFLLPSFHSIHIFPNEFFRAEPAPVFLAGNVSNNCIHVSWKHFLDGYHLPANGENVGLHEMAHAYHYQNFATVSDRDSCFCNNYASFEKLSTEMLSSTAAPALYTEYGRSSPEEFWAESVEIFFEKPFALRSAHPKLYDCISTLLNQTPHEVHTVTHAR